MKNKLYFMLSALLLSLSITVNAFAGELSTPKLDVPKFEVPDNMPDAFNSLLDKYNLAIEGMKEKGLDVNNYKNGIGDLTPPEGFGKTPEDLPSAEDIFKERYGDMWKNKPLDSDFGLKNLEGKDEKIKEWEESHTDLKPMPELENLPEFELPKLKTLQKDVQLSQKTLTSFAKMSDKEFNNYISNLEKKYTAIFNQKQPGEIAFENMKNPPAFQVTNKWANLMESPESLANNYKFLTDAEIQNMINKMSKPAGFDEIASKSFDELKNEVNKDAGNIFGEIKDRVLNTVGGLREKFGFNIDSIKGLLTGDKSDVYIDAYEKYLNNGNIIDIVKSTPQREKIFEVLKKHGIYDKDKESWISRAFNKKEFGKIIYDNLDLLKKEIPDLKPIKDFRK